MRKDVALHMEKLAKKGWNVGSKKAINLELMQKHTVFSSLDNVHFHYIAAILD